MRFDSTALDPDLIAALADKGFHTAFPIQELTLEMGIRGQDIIGQARTGTGKTLGFGLPLLHRIDPDKNFIQALIVAPTRELTAQVAEDLQIGSARGLNVTAVYGGVPIDPQFDALKRAHVVVGTPGRLLDHLNRGTMDLSRVSELVLDEADEMLDMGFLPDVERLMAACPSSDDRHTSLFSATMAPAIVSLARRYMNSPSFLHAKSDEPQTAELVEQHFFLVHRMDKPRVLARIMQQEGREGCYVFSRTKAMCDRLVTELEELGVKSIAIHGDLRQATREKNLDKFRSGEVSILVATEVAARGLDVDNVTHVVNYDCPDDEKMYLHRIGRTARAGREGVAVTFAQFNEVERLNVIRKSVGAYDGDLKEIFSTSAELQEIFDLPDETPWAHLSKKITPAKRGGSAKGGSSRGDSSKSDSSRGGSSKSGSSRGGSSRDDDRKRDDDRGGRNRDSGRDRDEAKTERPTRKPRADREAGRDEAQTDDRPTRKPRESRDEDRPTRKPRADRNRDDAPSDRAPRDRDSSRDGRDRDDSRDGGDDSGRNDRSRGARDEQPTTRTRTRTRTRTAPNDDRPARSDRDSGGRGRDGGDRDSGGRGRDGGDRDGRGRGDRDRNDHTSRDAGRDQDGNRAGRDDEDQPQSRPRARRRARGGRGAGEGTGSSSDDGKSRGAGHGREAEGRTRTSTDRTSSDRGGRDREGRTRDGRDGGEGEGRSRDGRNRDGGDRDGRSRDGGDRDSRNRSGGDRNSRDGRDDNDRDRKGGRGGRGRNNRSGSSRSQGGRNSGGSSSRGGNNNADRDRGSSSSQRQPARTTAERRTTRGDDARGEGTPRLARRVEVENLP